MKKLFLYSALFIIFQAICTDTSIGKYSIREPAVSGRFYPADADRLSKAVKVFFEDAVPGSGEKPLVIITPHAGYIYSGQICADAFKQSAGYKYDLIVLLGTNHTGIALNGISVYPEGGYKTPLGIAEIDKDAASQIMELDKNITFTPSAHIQEHSIEVLIPFVQTLFPEVKILPVIVGSNDSDLCVRFGKILAEALRNRNALIAASSDLSHYPDYDDAVKADRNTLNAIISLDTEKFINAVKNKGKIPNLSTFACGEAPIIAAMSAAKILGADCGRIISYANSGDAAMGSSERVVGYGAVSFTKSENCISKKMKKISGKTSFTPLNIHQKKTLLSFARKSISQYFTAETAPLPRTNDSRLQLKQGAFVTLKKHGRLRGCIGHMKDDIPLYKVIGEMALQAAFNDYRFNPLTKEELPDIEIEISVLTPFQEAERVEDIIVGRDGVLIKKYGRSAVFLPQVAPEQGWNRDEMLENLCRKAGLPSDAWKKDTRFYTFQADVFSESENKP